MMKRIVGMVAVVLMMAASVGHAEEPQGWKFSVMPYAWLAGAEGTVVVNGHTENFDKSFTDLFKAVDWAGSILANVQYDRYLFWVQEDYLKLSTSELDVDSEPKHGSLDSKVLISEAGVGYQVDGWMEGQTFDLDIGVRNLHMENDLTIYGVGTFSRTSNVNDPIFFLRPHVPLFPSEIKGLSFNGNFGAGGGGDSKFVYELSPMLKYEFTKNIFGEIGYRRVGWDFYQKNNSTNKVNISMAGMMFGIGVTF